MQQQAQQDLDETSVEHGETHSGGPWLGTAVTFALIVAALYFGRDVLIPLSIAILLSFLLAPVVAGLTKLRLPRAAAVSLVAAGAFTLIAAFGLLLGAQVTELARELPSYQLNISTKLREAREAAPSGGMLDRVSNMIQALRAEVEAAPQEAPDVPVVQLREPPPSPLDVIAEVAAPLLEPVGKAGIVVVLVLFILLEWEDLRNRLIRLLGPNLNLTTEALDEAGHRVSRYLLMQLVVNITYGIPFGIGLYAIGIPNALLWAVLAVLLRFIPYLGPLLSASFPLVLAVAVDPTWSTFLLTLGLILGLELVSNNIVEPFLYGASTSISAVAIIFAAIFWTMLWGPIGLLLSTPLTVCLAVMGRYFPRLAFLDVLLGSAPALSLPERFYQRLLAGDVDENVRIADEYLADHPLVAFYEDVAMPALRLAAEDADRRALTVERLRLVTRSVLQVVTELSDRDEPAESEEAAEPETGEHAQSKSVLCAAGRSGLDLAAGAMLAQLLERRGLTVRLVPAQMLAPEHLGRFDFSSFDLICLSQFETSAPERLRQACRRLLRRAPETPVVVGRWRQPEKGESERLPAQVVVVGTLQAAIDAVLGLVEEKGYSSAPIPADEAQRLSDLRELGGLNADAARFDRFTRRLSEAFHVPISLVTLVDEAHQNWIAQTGLPQNLAAAGNAPRETSICGHVVAGNEPLIVEDALKDPRFAGNPFLLDHGIRFYAGAPLRTRRGHAIGSICVIDAIPRTVTEEEKRLLSQTAEEIMRELEAEAASAGMSSKSSDTSEELPEPRPLRG